MGSNGSKRVIAATVSALAAAAIVGVAAWMLLGNNGERSPDSVDVQIIPPVESAVTEDSIDVAASPVPNLPGGTPTPERIAVYVTGEVVNPGVYTVAEGQRLANALELAGGTTENADMDRINLAAYVSDAAHYRIPAVGEPGDEAVGAAAAVVVASDGPSTANLEDVLTCAVPVNINTATAECLETLPGIGSVRAQSIVSHREQAGPFVTADGITAVSGIGDGIYGRIADMITVDGQ